MRTETVTYTEEIKVFDVGERVRATSLRSPLEQGRNYVVTTYSRPRFPGEQLVIFVEGREQGVSAEYVVGVDDGGEVAVMSGRRPTAVGVLVGMGARGRQYSPEGPVRPLCACGRHLVGDYVFSDGEKALAMTCACCALPGRRVEAAS